MLRTLPFTAALLLSLGLGGAQAGGAAPVVGGGQVLAATPAAVAAALREAGYTVTVNPANPDEAPSLTLKAGDYEFDVWFSGCKAGVCDRATATASWDYRDSPKNLDLDLVNKWNGDAFTQAYIYEGNYVLDSTLVLKGGATRVALKAWLTDYLADVKAFEAELP